MPLTNKLKIGDFVSYTPNSTSYKVTGADTESANNKERIIFDRTINPSELNLWRMIRKNDDGTVDVVSEYVSKEKVGIKGDNGCEYYIIILCWFLFDICLSNCSTKINFKNNWWKWNRIFTLYIRGIKKKEWKV